MRSGNRSAVAAALAALAISLAASGISVALPVTPGNIVIYRVGDGVAPLGSLGTPVFLDEFTTAGTLVQTIPVSTTGATQMVAVGNATTEGIISRSQDGTKLVFTGYRAAVGASPAGPSPTFNPRVIGTLDVTGVPNTSIAVTDAANVVPRSATTVDGSAYWLGSSLNVRYVGTPSAASTSVIVDARNSRQVNLDGNVLYASNGSTAVTAKVQSYGTLPTGLTTASPVVTLAGPDAVNGFTLLDLDASIPGPDTLYSLVTTLSQLQKYSFNGTSWVLTGSTASTANNVVGTDVGGLATLYLTTVGNLQVLNDANGYNLPIAGSISNLAAATTNTAFRGLGVMLVPEPSTVLLGAGGLACAGWAAVRRRRGAGRTAE